MAKIELRIKRVVTDTKTGKVISTKEEEAHSFVEQFLQMLSVHMAHDYAGSPDTKNITDTSGTPNAYTGGTIALHSCWAIEAPSGTVAFGIAIGTGTTPPASDDYQTETEIAHGVGAGQMQYGACGVQDPSGSGTVTFTITRAFINGSGGTITVKEVSLVTRSATDYYLLVHDAVNDAVNDGQTYTVTFTFATTV